MLDHERKNQASKARKENILLIIKILFLLLLLVVLVIIWIIYFLPRWLEEDKADNQADFECLQHGYLYSIKSRGQYFCIKRGYGGETVVPRDSLERGE